jgi:hypothetical protein
MSPVLRKSFCAVLFALYADGALGVEFEALGTAVEKALGTAKAFKKSVKLKGKETQVFYAKGAGGKASKFAVVQKGLYEPNCTHTWVVGLDSSASVEQIRVVEMSCSHAFPTKEASYLEQYKGKGPAAVSKLKGEIHTVAKATGSSDLTTEAVVTSITIVNKLKGKL